MLCEFYFHVRFLKDTRFVAFKLRFGPQSTLHVRHDFKKLKSEHLVPIMKPKNNGLFLSSSTQ